MPALSRETCSRCGGDHDPKASCAGGRAADATPPAVISVPVATERSRSVEARISVRDLDLSPGTVVGEYEVVRRIGSGAMGIVYEGLHPIIERKVAIKVLNRELAASSDAAQRLIQEARAANRVRHRNIVDVYSIGALPDGRLYLVMEFLEGMSLQRLVDERGPLPFVEAMVIAEGVLGALEAAHTAGVIHRDLKPENIFILPGPDNSIMRASVKLLDFGVAQMQSPRGDERGPMSTFDGAVVGTPAFMSPEQCRGAEAPDARSDLYSFGVVLYFVLSGRLPFDSGSYMQVIEQHLSEPPPPPSTWVDMPTSVEDVILRLLEKDPVRRYPSAEVVRVVLKACGDAWAWAPQRHAPGARRKEPPRRDAVAFLHTLDAQHAVIAAAVKNAVAEVAKAPKATPVRTTRESHESVPPVMAVGGEEITAPAPFHAPASPVTPSTSTPTMSPARRRVAIGLGIASVVACVVLIVAFARSSASRPTPVETPEPVAPINQIVIAPLTGTPKPVPAPSPSPAPAPAQPSQPVAAAPAPVAAETRPPSRPGDRRRLKKMRRRAAKTKAGAAKVGAAKPPSKKKLRRTAR